MLLQFVAAKNDELLGVILPQHDLHELLAERTGSASDQNNLFRPVHLHPKASRVSVLVSVIFRSIAEMEAI